MGSIRSEQYSQCASDRWAMPDRSGCVWSCEWLVLLNQLTDCLEHKVPASDDVPDRDSVYYRQSDSHPCVNCANCSERLVLQLELFTLNAALSMSMLAHTWKLCLSKWNRTATALSVCCSYAHRYLLRRYSCSI